MAEIDALKQLLDVGANHGPEYGGGLTNHLPMALVALRALGASDARLRSFAKAYATRLHSAPPLQVWRSGDPWTLRLGDHRAWPAYRHLFTRSIEEQGGASVLRTVLPTLLAGVGAAAFHGLIRSAYAVLSDHRGELADGLAYWASNHLPLGDSCVVIESGHPEVEPGFLLAQLLNATSGCVIQGALISERMYSAAALAPFARHVRRLAIDADGTLPVLARLAAEAYVQSADFTVLHLATSAHAMQVLWPFIEDRASALSHYWSAFAAGVVGTAWRPGPTPLPESNMLGWPVIVARALASNDEHVVKMVFSCAEQHRWDASDVWRRAATRAVGP